MGGLSRLLGEQEVLGGSRVFEPFAKQGVREDPWRRCVGIEDVG